MKGFETKTLENVALQYGILWPKKVAKQHKKRLLSNFYFELAI